MLKPTRLHFLVFTSTMLNASVGAQAATVAANSDAIPIWAPLIGLPIVVATFFILRAIVRMMAYTSGEQYRSRGAATFPHLPENLRLIYVAGLQYPMETVCGSVIKKEPTDSPNVETMTVRKSDKREMTWTFSTDEFKAVEGQIVTAIFMRSHENNPIFLIYYNHATDQFLEQPAGFQEVHNTNLRPGWIAGTVAGSLGFVIGFGLLLSRILPDPTQADLTHLAIDALVLLVISILSAALASYVVGRQVGPGIVADRTEFFIREFKPQFLQFLRESTPAVEKRMANPGYSGASVKRSR